MSYTLSFDASVKVQRGGVAGLLHHIAREVDKQNGQEVRHANQDIDPARTADNMTMVSDGNGNWTLCRDPKEIEAALDARLATVSKPLRKDAVVLRPLLLQLDPEWYAAHQDQQEREAARWAMEDWAVKTFGAGNLVYIAMHEDEGNPHLHIGFCPVTDDGRLAQKDWFPGPTALRFMHKDFRQHMTDRGYDIDMTNRKPGKYAKRMSVEEYKDFRDLMQQRAEIEAQAQAVQERAAELTAREAAVAAQEARVAEDGQKVAQEREAVQEARRTAQDAARMHDAFNVTLNRRHKQDSARLRERERELRRREQDVAKKEAAMDAMQRARYARQLQLQEQQQRDREQQRQQDGEALTAGVLDRGPRNEGRGVR